MRIPRIPKVGVFSFLTVSAIVIGVFPSPFVSASEPPRDIVGNSNRTRPARRTGRYSESDPGGAG